MQNASCSLEKQTSRGQKHNCSHCKKNFYDLGRALAVCPGCSLSSQPQSTLLTPDTEETVSLDTPALSPEDMREIARIGPDIEDPSDIDDTRDLLDFSYNNTVFFEDF